MNDKRSALVTGITGTGVTRMLEAMRLMLQRRRRAAGELSGRPPV